MRPSTKRKWLALRNAVVSGLGLMAAFALLAGALLAIVLPI